MIIKIGTYNICHCADFSSAGKDWSSSELPDEVSIERTANVIRSLGCDFIGLNEVYENGTNPREDFKFQTKKLAELAGYPYYYYAQGHDYEYTDIGNAVLSKFPIKDYKTVVIPTVPESERTGDYWYENRILTVSDVDFNGKTVRMIATHFGLAPVELERIVKKSTEIIDGSKLPVCMFGDFNVLPDNAWLKGISARLKSAAEATGNSDFTWSSYNPNSRIDYIFVPKSAKVTSYTVHRIKVSDHFPITAEIEL